MKAQATEYINFVKFSGLINWSVSGLLEANFNYSLKYDLAPISEFLIMNKEVVNINDDKIYKRVKVRINNNGVVLRDEETGRNIGTKKQYLAREGQFIVSKIDARNGAFGVIPKDLDGSIVTNDFPLFNVNSKKILPQFLLLITTTKKFIRFAQSCSSGTTNRQRMDIDLFLQQKVPLPPIAEQKVIVDNFNDKIEQGKKLVFSSNRIKKEIKRFLSQQFGIIPPLKKSNTGKLVIVQFCDLLRWDGNTEITINSIYPVEKIGRFIININTGTTPPTGIKEYFEGDVNFYTPSELGEEMYLKNSERKISELAIKDKKARVFPRGTLLFVGIGSTVGKVGIVDNTYAASNQQITGFQIDENHLLKEFVYHYFNCFKEITTRELTRATLPIVNQDKILNIPIPVPPVNVQKEIIGIVNKMNREANKNLKEGLEFIEISLADFEKNIFNQYENLVT